MRTEHSFDIYAKLYMPTHHFEFSVSFFLLCFGHLFGVMVCRVRHSSLRQTVRPSVCLSVCPSLCEHVSSPITMVLYQMIRNTYCLWLPNFQGHMANFKVTQRLVTTRHTNLVPLLYGVKADPMVGSGQYAEPIPVKSPVTGVSRIIPVVTTATPTSGA